MKTENMHVKMGEGVGFERIRRITGYLVGTMDKGTMQSVPKSGTA